MHQLALKAVKELAPTLKHTLTVDASYNAREMKIGIGIVIQATTLEGNRGPIIEEQAETYSPAKGKPGWSAVRNIVARFEHQVRVDKMEYDDPIYVVPILGRETRLVPN